MNKDDFVIDNIVSAQIESPIPQYKKVPTFFECVFDTDRQHMGLLDYYTWKKDDAITNNKKVNEWHEKLNRGEIELTPDGDRYVIMRFNQLKDLTTTYTTNKGE